MKQKPLRIPKRHPNNLCYLKTIESCVPDTRGDAEGPVSVGDVVYLINYIFNGGAGPVMPCTWQ